MITERECIDDEGFDGLLRYAHRYLVRPLCCGAVEFRADDGRWYVAAGSRFQ
jgi:hypothetical protein